MKVPCGRRDQTGTRLYRVSRIDRVTKELSDLKGACDQTSDSFLNFSA